MQPVGPVSPGRRDDGVAQEPQQLRNGDRDQPGVQVRAGVVLALHGDSVRDDLASVVHQALEPAHISLWISQHD